MRVCRREQFNCAHRLNNPNWSAEKNLEIFGKCNSPNYHGHNYVLETWVDGEIDPETGYVIDTKVLKDIIRAQVTEPFDHKNLNLDVADFANLNPTAENIAVVIWNRLRPHIPVNLSLQIRLSETENNFVEYDGLSR